MIGHSTSEARWARTQRRGALLVLAVFALALAGGAVGALAGFARWSRAVCGGCP